MDVHRLDQANRQPPGVLVMGASGRLGRMLAQGWRHADMTLFWQFRGRAPTAQGLVWAPLDDLRAPRVLEGRVDVILCLAGVITGDARALEANSRLALAAITAAQDLGARHVLLSSSAAVYGQSAAPTREDAPTCPDAAYGAAKLAMERDAQARASAAGVGCTSLRFGNIAGADGLLGAIRPGRRPRLDQFADGLGPVRSYLGPATLANILHQLVTHLHEGGRVPSVLNVAQSPAVAMADLLDAADIGWDWTPAPEAARQHAVMDLTRLCALLRVPAATPSQLVAEWRAWQKACE